MTRDAKCSLPICSNYRIPHELLHRAHTVLSIRKQVCTHSPEHVHPQILGAFFKAISSAALNSSLNMMAYLCDGAAEGVWDIILFS